MQRQLANQTNGTGASCRDLVEALCEGTHQSIEDYSELAVQLRTAAQYWPLFMNGKKGTLYCFVMEVQAFM